MGLADSRLAAQWLEEAARELGLCVIAPDRPGTGGTDRRWLSQLADWAAGKGRAGSDPPQPGSAGSTSPPVSTEDGLRSLHDDPVIIPPVPLPRVSRQQRPQQRPLPVGQIICRFSRSSSISQFKPIPTR